MTGDYRELGVFWGLSPLLSEVKREDGLSHNHFLLSAVQRVCHSADVEMLSGLTFLIVRIEITNKMRPCSRIYYSNVS